MCMTEVLTSSWYLVLKCGSKFGQPWITLSRHWLRGRMLQTIGLNMKTWSSCMYLKRTDNPLSISLLRHDFTNPTFTREHMQSPDFYTGGTKGWQERLEPLGTDPRTHCSCQVFIIHLWETGTLATRNGLSMREVPLAYFMSFYKNIFVRFWQHICWNCSRWGGVFLNLQRT